MSKRLLILGGTQFVGRHLAECALDRAHEVTLFHRGKTGKGLLAGANEVF
ncbi:MAG TPA: epimerase, partial [Planctomycetota bacterium]|nr:epimerase [Planctomycetota bacterium]